MSFKKILISPIGPLIFPLFLFIIAFIIPPNIYEYYINEKDYIFLNINVLLYILIVIFFYWIGVYVSNFKINNKYTYITSLRNKGKINFLFIVVLLVLGIELIYIFVLNQYYKAYLGNSMFLILLSGVGDIIKQSGTPTLPYHLNAVPRLFPAIMFWLLYEVYSPLYKNSFLTWQIKKLIFFESFLLAVILLISSDRTMFSILFLGWICIYMYYNPKKSFKTLLYIFLVVVAMFILTSLLRWSLTTGNDISFLLISKFMGYTLANYNRLALILTGELNYHLPEGFYLFPIMNIPLLNIFPYEKLKDFTDFADITLSAVNNTGLNAHYNQCTLFGGMFQELGIATPLYFFFLGIIGNRLFHSFKKGSLIGIVMYPLFWASVALWSSDINIFVYNIIYFIMALFLINAFIFTLRIITKGQKH